VIDLRSLAPLDIETVAASVEKTGRAIVICEDCITGGVSAEVAAQIMEQCFDYLNAPIRRVAAADTPVPCADILEKAALPDANKIADAVKELMAEYA
jgi:pyruvate/2-oxoglutarate/acetoin dehydrogenase E1 component